MDEDCYFFYGGYCSQWFHSDFVVKEVEYNTAEQYMMAMKAAEFGDTDIQQEIMESESPRDQKALGRQVRDFDPDHWNAVARDHVYEGNYAKFTQNEGLKLCLLATGDKELVEASPTDRIWGIGLGIDDERREDRGNWRGTNWLGEVLMKVRDDIRAGVKTETGDFPWN